MRIEADDRPAFITRVACNVDPRATLVAANINREIPERSKREQTSDALL